MRKSAQIVGVGSYVPDVVVTNHELERHVSRTNQWIVDKTGIRERRACREQEATSDLAERAARAAIASAAIDPSDIDLIVLATITPDRLVPATACVVQERLGAANCVAFDVNAACAGFLVGLDIAWKHLQSNGRAALLIGAEAFSKIIHYSERFFSVILGDGAGAVVLTPCATDHGIQSIYLRTDGQYHDVVKIPAGGSRLPASHATIDQALHTLTMDPRKVYDLALNLLPDAVHRACAAAKCTLADIGCLIAHQANKNLLSDVMRVLEIPDHRTHLTVERFGNTSAASIPITLADALTSNKLKQGNLICMTSIGAGFVSGAAVLRWEALGASRAVAPRIASKPSVPGYPMLSQALVEDVP